MYARNVTLRLRANQASDFSKAIETDVIPVLRKQNGFRDEMTLVARDGGEAVAISLWDTKESAEAYGRDAYPQVLESLVDVVDGTPEIVGYEVTNSTFHEIGAINN